MTGRLWSLIVAESVNSRECYRLSRCFVDLCERAMTVAEDPEFVIFSLSFLMLLNKPVFVTSNALTHRDVTLRNYFYEGMLILVDGVSYRITTIIRPLFKIQFEKKDDPDVHLILDINSNRITVSSDEILKAYTHWLNSLQPGTPVDYLEIQKDGSNGWSRGVVSSLTPICSVYYGDYDDQPLFTTLHDMNLSTIQKANTMSYGESYDTMYQCTLPLWDKPFPVNENNHSLSQPARGFTAGPILFHNEYPFSLICE